MKSWKDRAAALILRQKEKEEEIDWQEQAQNELNAERYTAVRRNFDHLTHSLLFIVQYYYGVSVGMAFKLQSLIDFIPTGSLKREEEFDRIFPFRATTGRHAHLFGGNLAMVSEGDAIAYFGNSVKGLLGSKRRTGYDSATLNEYFNVLAGNLARTSEAVFKNELGVRYGPARKEFIQQISASITSEFIKLSVQFLLKNKDRRIALIGTTRQERARRPRPASREEAMRRRRRQEGLPEEPEDEEAEEEAEEIPEDLREEVEKKIRDAITGSITRDVKGWVVAIYKLLELFWTFADAEDIFERKNEIDNVVGVAKRYSNAFSANVHFAYANV
jgi:hypothetical protein